MGGPNLKRVENDDVRNDVNPERELPDSHGVLRAIVDGSPLGIIAIDAGGRVCLWNAGAERILGYARAQVLGEPSPFSFSARSEQGREYKAMHAGNTEVDLLCSVAPMNGPDGTVTGWVAMFSDITENKRFNRKMEHTQRLESLGILAGGVAHDFNNLLTGILGNASLGLHLLSGDNEVRPLLQEIEGAAERAAGLTRQLLAYAGKGRFIAVKVKLSGLTQEIATLAHASIPNKRVLLHLHLDADMPLIEADPTQLQQVIFNLIINAAESIEETQAGEVHVTVRGEKTLEPMLDLSATGATLAPGEYAVLEVCDSGCGMDEATCARIFEPFFSTKFTGRGLGLSAVLGIVRQHHGAISVHTIPGKGSTFRVFLPLIGAEQGTHAGSEPVQDLRGAGLVLVVDDEETVRMTTQRALEHWNYRVVLAENGQAALEVVRNLADHLSVVILDLMMPVMGAEEALLHLQRMRPDLPVILMSGYTEADARARLHGKGECVFLQKPFTTEQLGRKIQESLQRQAPHNRG